MKLPMLGPIKTARNDDKAGVDVLAFFPTMVLVAIAVGIVMLIPRAVWRVTRRNHVS